MVLLLVVVLQPLPVVFSTRTESALVLVEVNALIQMAIDLLMILV